MWNYKLSTIKYLPTWWLTDVNESDSRSNVHYLGSSENKAGKNSGLYGIWTHDLCDTGAVLYQLS